MNKIFSLLIAVLFFYNSSNSQTTLKLGDFAILGVNANVGAPWTNGDEISFVCFKDITTGTQLQLTDNGYSSCTAGLWSVAEGGATVTRTGGTIPAGTVVTLRTAPLTFLYPDASWTVADLLPGSVTANFQSGVGFGGINMNSGGDQIYFAQNGTWTNKGGSCISGRSEGDFPGPNGTILFGFSTGGTGSGGTNPWTDNQGNTTNSGLYPGMGCFSSSPIGGKSDFNKYTGPLTPATQKVWLTRINNKNNWSNYANSNAYNTANPLFKSLVLTINPGGGFPDPQWASPASAICETNTSFDLNTLVTGTTGGTWSGTSTSNAGIFNATGLNGNYNLTYSVNGSTCPITKTNTVTVTTQTVPTFTQVADICAGGTFTLPTTSNDSKTGTWSPVIDNTKTTTYTFTPTAGQCAKTATMTVTVKALTTPTFNPIATICEGGTFTLPTTSNNSIMGTWSPSIDNTTTTTYTFTPNAGQCASTATMTVTVNAKTVPVFTQVSAICSGGSFTLPTTSINGITGSWSPAINNTATTTYTFTPTAGQCATTASMTVTVNSTLTTPVFTQIPAICNGGTINLPFTSNNSITGTWSPAIDNTNTTTYTFTPTAGQCANTGTMTVTVNPIIVPSFTQIPVVCNGENFVLPTTSNNGITGTWSPAIDNANTTTYTFTPTAGQCATTATMTVTVNTKTVPSFTQVAAICNGGSFTLPTTSLEGVTGTWSPAINNTTTTTYTFTPTAGLCAITATMTVTVNTKTVPTFTQVAAICNGGSFTLPTTSLEGVTGTWSPAINNTTTTTYTFTPTSGLCATTATMTVTVNTKTVPTFTQVAAICNGGSFTLPTISNNGVTGTWSPAINNSATTIYTFTPTTGLCATTATMTVTVNTKTVPTFTQVAAICNGGSFTLPTTSLEGVTGTWSPAINNTTTTTYTFTPTTGLCATTSTMTVTVNTKTVPTFTQVAAICNGGSFTLPTISNNGVTGTWSPAINNSATTIYTFTPTTGLCATTATMTVTVNAKTIPTFTQVAAICNGGSFTLPTTSLEGVTGTWSPAINNSATTIYTFTPTTGQCATTATMTVTVNAKTIPTFTQVAAICNGSTFTLPTRSNNGITGTWSPAINKTATTTYTFKPTTGQCATTATMTVTVNAKTIPTFTQVASICNGSTFTLPTRSNNGITGTWSPAINNTTTTTYTFTPTSGLCATTATMTVTVNAKTIPTFTQVASICNGSTFTLPTRSNNGITGTWSPAINKTATTTYTFTPTTGQCATTATMTVTVNAKTIPTFTQVASICNGSTFTLPTRSNNGITGTWSPAINNSATTIYTFTPTTGLCATTATMTVTVNAKTVPTFTQVAAICNGGSFTLPTTSNNGITGTWSPAINNSATTIYTFTPTTGLCATTATMTVRVNAKTVPTFTQVAAICNGGSFTLPTTSNNGVTGTWSPAINNSATTIYTFTPTTGLCATTTTMTVTVNAKTLPTFTQVAAICNGGSFTLPTTSNNGVTGTWSPAINKSATTTYTFTPTAGQCAITATMTVTVNAKTVPTFTQIASICNGSTFTLPTRSNNGVTGTWSPAINNSVTTIYTFTPTTGLCATTATMTVTVNAKIVPTFASISPICSGDALSLPTSSLNGIVGTWSPVINNTQTTTYTFTPIANQCGTTATITVKVNPKVKVPNITSTGSDLVCIGTTKQLNNTLIGGTWTSSATNVATVDATGLITPRNNGSVDIVYSVTGLCGISSSKPYTLTVDAKPFVYGIGATATDVCKDKKIVLTNVTQNGVWSSDKPSIASVSSNGIVTGNSVGTNTIKYTLSNGCGSEFKSIAIKVRGDKVTNKGRAPKGPSCIYPLSGTVDFNFTGTESPYKVMLDGTTYNTPITIGNLGTTRPYQFYVYNTYGCLVETLPEITLSFNGIGCDTVYVPSGFVPNYSSGKNHTLKPFGAANLQYLNFVVYNRMGQIVFQSHDINQGWDGTLGGKIQEVGTYVWFLEYTTAAGFHKSAKGVSVLIK